MVQQEIPWEQNLISCLDQSLLDSLDYWNDLRLAIDVLTNKYTDDQMEMIDEIEAQSVPDNLKAPDEATCQFFDKVLDAAHCTCGKSHGRDLRLKLGPLGTYRRFGQKPSPKSVFMLLRRDLKGDGVSRWHELDVAAFEADGEQPSESNCVCNYLEKHTSIDYQLNLVLVEDTLIPAPNLHRPRNTLFRPESLQRQFDLSSLIFLKDKQWDMRTKWALSILLSYTLLYLHGGSQVHNKWKRENIFFFQDGPYVPLRPFLGNAKAATIEPGDFHKFPHILLLGVMLLEIFLGQSLESFLKLTEPIPNMDDLWRHAWTAFETPEFFHFPPLFRQAIRSCLSPATFSNLTGDRINEEIRLEFFRRIVSPLEIAAFRHFTLLDKNNLDESVAMAFDLARGVSPATLDALPFHDISTNIGKGHTDLIAPDAGGWEVVQPSQRCFRNNDKVSPGRTITRIRNVSETSMTSDMKPRPKSSSAIENWLDWLDDFQTFREATFPKANDYTLRPRVTIIDTGIDAAHPLIKEAKRTSRTSKAKCLFRDFSGQDSLEAVDDDGHGTFVAGILLQVAPVAELYVARIGVTRFSISQDVGIEDKIAESIKYAVDTWKTDIISMSFSQPTSNAKLRDAIASVIGKNVIVLAAAGNHGMTRPISFPASYERVLKILATNTQGGMESFSAVPELGKMQDCFAAPGYEIVSAWPSHLLEAAEEDDLDVFCWLSSANGASSGCVHPGSPCDTRTVMSGTSFSTPIVAGIVSLLYHFFDATKGYSDAVLLKAGSEDSFKTPTAVSTLLEALCRTSDQQPYKFISPQWGKDGQMHFKVNEERSLKQEDVDIFGRNRRTFFSWRLSEILSQAGL